MSYPERTTKQYVLRCKRTGKQFYLPLLSGLAWPKHSHTLDDVSTLKTLLNSTDAEVWSRYCHPSYLLRASFDEGVFLFTTFDVPGFSKQRRFLEPVPPCCAEEALSMASARLAVNDRPQPGNFRQVSRFLSLEWTRSLCGD
eukprot:6653247-Prymnesium_polylepis.1